MWEKRKNRKRCFYRESVFAEILYPYPSVLHFGGQINVLETSRRKKSGLGLHEQLLNQRLTLYSGMALLISQGHGIGELREGKHCPVGLMSPVDGEVINIPVKML